MVEIRTLLWLALRRADFRIRRTAARMVSPRRALATLATIVFIGAYLANGVWMLSAREPADPTRLQWWLSGGMVIYAVYHAIRCVYQTKVDDLELTPAETLWVVGGPTTQSSAIVCLMIDRVMASAVKTSLMMVALWVDSPCPPLLALGVFSSLVTIDVMRLVIVRSLQMLTPTHHRAAKVAITAVVVAMIAFVLATIVSQTATGSSPIIYAFASFSALGDLASSEAVQWMAIPFRPSANLAVATEFARASTLTSLAGSFGFVAGLIVLYGHVNRMAERRGRQQERERLEEMDTGIDEVSSLVGRTEFPGDWSSSRSAWRVLLERQLANARRYAGTILTSFAIPILLCLSPILSDELHARWLFVVGGIGFCTAMLAPAALKIDFRRDLKRMTLLRSMPVSASTMVTSQLTMPVAITVVFQTIVLIVAGCVLQPGWSAMLLWGGMLPALAVAVFAIENALFLVYPHHAHAQGVAMLIRAKLTFLGKATALAVAVGGLLAWAILCRTHLPESLSMPVMVSGAVIAAWLFAMTCFAAVIASWRRFDLSSDLPPA